MPIRSISTQQAGQQLDATHFLNVAAFPIKIQQIEGYCGGASGTQYYLQLHTGVPVSTTTVPIWSMQVQAVNGFSFEYPLLDGLNTALMSLDATTLQPSPNRGGVYVAISSTDTVYTSVAAATDCRVDFEEYELELPNKTFVGDTSTSVGSLQVWTEAAGLSTGGKHLLKVEAQNNNATTQYLMLFAKDAAPSTGDSPIQTWTFATTIANTLNFGAAFVPRQVLSTGANVLGCTFRVSSTSPTFTAVANGWTIRATYVP